MRFPSVWTARGRRRELCAVAIAALTMILANGTAEAVQRRAFVTSIKGTGDLSTWQHAAGTTAQERADAICRFLAGDAQPSALPNAGSYRAWLSTTEASAYCHVQGFTGTQENGCHDAVLPGAGPWFLSNGLTLATASLDDLVEQGEIYRSFLLDENGAPISGSNVERNYWTGTTKAGELSDDHHCADWTVGTDAATGASGDAYGAAESWTLSAWGGCASTQRLLCLEPSPGDGALPGWAPGASRV